MHDLVVAVATPPGESAIAVIRITGEGCLQLISTLANGKILPPRVASRVYLRNPETQTLLDDTIVVPYKAPASYTGEDMVEIFCHGGSIPTQSIFQELVRLGCKPAPPGEFTKRAVLNGKMDMVQAEAVEQIVKARSKQEVSLSLQSLQGNLSVTFQNLLQQLTKIHTSMEAQISFPDDVEEDHAINQSIAEVLMSLQELHQSANYIRQLNKGFSIVLMGKTNVGKSTLFNTLLGFDRTLVSPYPSTTHDFVSEDVFWEGFNCTLYDTAGYISQTSNPLDRLFNDRMEDLFKKAFQLIYVIDAIEFSTEDINLIQQYKTDNMIVVINKTDLQEKIDWLNQLPEDIQIIQVSAKQKTGIQNLVQAIVSQIQKCTGPKPDHYINERQNALVIRMEQILQKIVSQEIPYLDMAMVDIQECIYILKEELNMSHSNQLFDDIFSRFCIGK